MALRNKKMKPKALVNKATSDDRTPPSGYILEELAKKSFSVTECDEIESLILKKLSKNKPYVKKKALRVVKFICDKGSPQWKRSWQRHTDKLKECQQYRGPPDQVYGDSPYKEVRDAAKDAMTAVFAVMQADNSAIKKRIKGLTGGETAYSSSGVVKKATFGTGTSGVYNNPNRPRGPAPKNSNRSIGSEGTGNTNFRPSTRNKPFKPLESSGGYDPAKYGHKNPYSVGTLDNRTARGGSKRKRKTAGGVWGDDDEDDNDAEDSYDRNDNEAFPGNESSTNNPTFRSSSNGISSGNKNKRRTSRSDGRFERKWVDDICKGAGIGIKINRNDLTKYVQQFENLSQDHVLEYLDDKLIGADSWKEQGKALTLIEGLLDGSSSSNVEEYFQQSYESLQFLAQEGKPILKKKAKALLEIIGIDEDEQEDDTNNNNVQSDETEQKVESTQQPQQQAPPKEENLLDFMNSDPAPAAAPAQDQGVDTLLQGLTLQDPTTNGDADNDGMFDNMEVAESGQQAPQNGVSALLPQTGTNTSNQAPAQNTGSLLLPSGNANNSNQTNTNGNTNNNNGNNSGPSDFFDGLGMTQENSNMTQVISQQTNQGQQASTGSGQGGGFSFITGNNASNGNANAQNGQAQQNQQGQQQGQQQGGSSFKFVQANNNVQAQSNSMKALMQQTNQNVNQMNNMIGNMNTISNMMQQAQMGQNQMGSGLNTMGSGMNNMGGGMNNMGNGMNALSQMGTGMNMGGMQAMGGGMGAMGMQRMNNMNNMNQQMGGMGMRMNNMNTMNTMNGMGGMSGMNNMNAMNNMNNMNMRGGMGGMNTMNTMNNMNQGGGMNQNPSGMNQMMMNNMSMFSGTATAMNQHHNPLSQMRQNDPFAAVMGGGSANTMQSNSAAQNQPKKPKNDPFSSFNLTNLT